MKQKLLQGIIYLCVSLFFIGCGEPVPVACTPDEEECATEQEGGFETGPVAGIAAGGAAVLALAAGGLSADGSGDSSASPSNEASIAEEASITPHSNDITLSYSAELSEIINSQSATITSIVDNIEALPGCQLSKSPQDINLILAQGCVNFQDIHYRPSYLPSNLDGLSQINDYVDVVRQNDRFSYYFEPVSFSENTQALS